MVWRRIGDVLQAQALAAGLAGLCAGVAAWVLNVLAQMPLWIAVIFALSIFLIALVILRTLLPPFLGWLAHLVRNGPPNQPAYRIENIHLTVQITDSGNITVTYPSEKVVVTPEGEGPLLPRGTIINRSWADSVKVTDAWTAEVIRPPTEPPKE